MKTSRYFIAMGLLVLALIFVAGTSRVVNLGNNFLAAVLSSSTSTTGEFTFSPNSLFLEVTGDKAKFSNVASVSFPYIPGTLWPAWYITNTAPWNNIYYHYGKTLPNGWGPGKIEWTTDLTGYAPGTYTDTITLRSEGYAPVTFTQTVRVLSGGTSTTTPPVVTIPVEPAVTSPAPTLTFSSNVSTVPYNGNVTLTWASTNATVCMSSGSWTGDRYLSNTRTFTNITENKTYTLTCTGAGGSVTKSVSVGVTGVVTKLVPVVSLSVSPTVGTVNSVNPTISWSATNNPTSCTASGDWSGSKPVTGNAVSLGVLSVAKTYTYTLVCSNSVGSSASQSASISVSAVPVIADKFPPSIALGANPTSITAGQTSTISWSASPASACSSPKWSSTSISGSTVVSPTQTTTYAITCVNGTGGPSSNSSVTVSVISAPLPSTKFKINDSVQTTSTLNVRSAPSSTATLVGTQSLGARGTVTGGPVSSGGYWWWQVTFANGMKGWSVENYLIFSLVPTPEPTLVPTLSLSSNVSSVTSGGNATLTWSSTNATTCTASGSWTGTQTLSGSQTFSNLTANKTYSLTCTGAGGSATKSVSVGVTATPPQTGQQISVNTGIRYQQISGWEATSQAGQGVSPAFPMYQSNLMNMAVNDLGINRIRLEIRSGAENSVDYYAQYRAGTITNEVFRPTWFAWVNDNNDPNVINPAGFQFTMLDEWIDSIVVPMRQRLAARGESLYLNLNYVSFRNSTAQQNPNEYAELILATFQHMQSKYGFVPNAVEVILEPDNNTIWSGWNNSTAIGQAIAVTGARLAAAGFRPDFIAPSVMNMANAVPFLNQIVAVPGALPYLKEVSYHRYSGVSDANLVAIKNSANQYGLRTSMLEHIGSGVEDLYKDLTLANVSAWQQYTLAFPTSDDGAQYYTITNNAPVMGSRTPGLRQYFKYVRNGAYRVSAVSTDSTLRPVAFTNPNGKAVVVVHVDQAKTVSMSGLPSGSYEAVFLPSGASTPISSTVTAVGGSLSISVTSVGILTVRGI